MQGQATQSPIPNWGLRSLSPNLEARTAEVERIVRAAWNIEELALVAVGGFGRRELFPHSDVDLLLLGKQAPREAIAEFLRTLWDAGLRVSQSVHSVAECCELDEANVELAISLLSHRYLAGDRALYERLERQFARFVHAERQSLARRLCRMARARHAKHGASIYQLEPNIKEGPGGLRDLQTIAWLRQVRTGTASLPSELLPARDLLFSIRWFLHTACGRDMNTLTFDLAEEIADRAGAGPAEWMRGYYARAREVWRAVLREIEAAEEQGSNLLVQFRDWRSRVSNADFHVSRERVYFREPHRIEYEPPLVLSLFQFAARHRMRLAEETERRIAEHLPRLEQYFAGPRPAAWTALRDILAQPHSAIALRAMHATGVLAALFPEWRHADCLVVRDFYHRYTVDEHTLVAIEAVEALRESGHDKRFSDLLAETEDLPLVKFALLFHDLGKGHADGRHVDRSAALAAAAMERIQMPVAERRVVRRLIDQHLELSTALSRRDLDDPATARALAARAGTLEDLKRLTLVTYADISAVNPAAMTPWRLEQLWRVYLITHNELTRELASERIERPSAEAGEFAEGFPVRYLRTQPPEAVRAHAALAARSRERGVAVDLAAENGVYRLTFVARDSPFLFASAAGAIASFGLNILKAEGFANRRGEVLDTFVFSDPHRTLELNPTEADRLRLTVERAVLGRVDVQTLLQNRPLPPPPSKRHRIRPSVTISDSEAATLVEIVAEDRPGLLYSLASAISKAGAHIELVLVDTEAHKAIDVFYLSKLTPDQKVALDGALLKSTAP